ncbi:MAG: sulfite exporter TauE/SafE family protein [Gammaproteobacteria bacterium]
MGLPELDMWIIVWCGFALFCGGLIKGTLGVGTPLLTVPLMALVVPAQTAVVLMAIPVVVANVWQATRAKEVATVVSRFWPMFLAILAGTLGGVFILANIDDRTLLLVVGLLVIAFTILQGSSYKFQISTRAEKPAGMFFGLASGLVGGLSSMFGPMLIIYLVSLPGLNKERFVASISFLYIACVVPWAMLLIGFGVLDLELTVLSTAATLPVVAGLILGEKLRSRVSDERFSRMVLVVLLVSGGTMLFRAFS